MSATALGVVERTGSADVLSDGRTVTRSRLRGQRLAPADGVATVATDGSWPRGPSVVVAHLGAAPTQRFTVLSAGVDGDVDVRLVSRCSSGDVASRRRDRPSGLR